MELQGRIIQVLPAKNGVSAQSGKSWMTQQYVIETDGKYPKKVPFEIFGEDKIKQFNLQVGDEVTIQFDLEGSEFNEKWYVRVKCYNVKKTDLFGQQPQPQPIPQTVIYPDKPQPASPPINPETGETHSDDLPF
jgi:hypothetical protein